MIYIILLPPSMSTCNVSLSYKRLNVVLDTSFWLQDSAMNENQESEPLIDEDEYHHLLRNDSFLTRLGSDNFASLIEPSASLPSGNDDLSHQLQQQQPLQEPPQPQQMPVMHFHSSPIIQEPLFISDGLVTSDLQTESSWNNLETVSVSLYACP